MTKHTPTPWVYESQGTSTGIYAKNAGYGMDNNIVRVFDNPSKQIGEANAAFIVKAVNCHAELVKALKELMDACYKADLHEELSEFVDGSLLDAAEKALAKAKGGAA